MKKIELIENPKIIMSNPMSLHNYFAWPSIIRLQNGKIAVAASGFRLHHVCPFGKAVIAFSEDNGETYTAPIPVIDTVLDDRDAGLCTFGESGLIVTSFNNTATQQKAWNREISMPDSIRAYREAYLDNITEEQQNKVIGSTFRISNDCGVTFGDLHISPVTSPHGPIELKDGTVLWVGRIFNENQDFESEKNTLPVIQAHKINPDGSMELIGCIPDISNRNSSYEPYTVELDDGTLITQIRYHGPECGMTIYQSVSKDSGKTWSEPVPIIEGQNQDAPSHILKHSSGTLVMTYGHRETPCGVRVAFSDDNGKTWDSGYTLSKSFDTDCGYPMSAELDDGSIITVYYSKDAEDDPCEIRQQKWRFE